ncbi:serine hydrolase domain-containing protein [Paenibacillus oceani]|uniref:Beta-lactamase family protein n=1 Tax=Paenibacillus oceani TaxID=2772510 RepID=A0A927CEG4_9BACL|nr:serine hydrolase domain-containing protein [Paenibacillus oceani]MBD2865974.1 beta-lactamase family protein [Paenibacillus oceani]
MIRETEVPLYHDGRTDATPEQAAYDPARLARLDEHLSDLISQNKLQCGSYLLARDGRIFAHRAMGKLTYREGGPDLMPDSIRKTYSVTKFFTAVAVMQLIEEGKLYLEQAVSTVLKPFDTPLHRSITVFHLLTHTSGVYPDPGCMMEPYPTAWFGGLKGYDDWVTNAISGPLSFKPGEQYAYSSCGYAILGEIIAKVSGIPYEQYILQHIIEPLGMTRTFFKVPVHLRDEVCVTSDWQVEELEWSEERADGPPPAGGGLYSTLEDMWKLGQMMLDGGTFGGVRILSRKSVEAMTKNKLSGVKTHVWGSNVTDYQFGLGLFLTTPTIETPGTYGHEGFGRCGIKVDPEERFVAVFIVPTGIQWAPESVIGTKAVIWSGLL